MRSFADAWNLMSALYNDLSEGEDHSDFFSDPPLLAHYTTTFVLEQIAKYNQIWFGNPLLMNDIEEVRFGINEGLRTFLASQIIRDSFASPADAEHFERQLNAAYQNFDSNHAFDTYILCLCEHSRTDEDGLLSMWRGYGDSGKGVAVVFDPRGVLETPTSPLIIAKVRYASTDDRYGWFDKIAGEFAGIIAQQRIEGSDEVAGSAWGLFARLRQFALFTKHHGFSEEREWRLAYLPERDPDGGLKQFLGYHNGARGIEPKLKLPVAPNAAFGGQDISLERLVHSIILGPSASSAIAVRSAQRMLELLNRPILAQRVQGSTIPYRNY
ncbi:DUF2971 domain-containing protein [Devosia ginsengisoli]|uniref:DUF2971 domain-containing protein n=1 Tax=Devosia ginsengisoli TaxID=400770 RepID=A0A5B8LUB0_9HYPH|nr:DUF2971 domain-containing protein [Devosia ginsengisoli]QDZ10920.1 DUF2971 domain-containing protein [Devosia ginsengisoli]